MPTLRRDVDSIDEENEIVQATINERGEVEDVTVLRGQPMGLTEEAVEAVRQWRFAPAQLNGKPVAVYFNLVVRFELR